MMISSNEIDGNIHEYGYVCIQHGNLMSIGQRHINNDGGWFWVKGSKVDANTAMNDIKKEWPDFYDVVKVLSFREKLD